MTARTISKTPPLPKSISSILQFVGLGNDNTVESATWIEPGLSRLIALTDLHKPLLKLDPQMLIAER